MQEELMTKNKEDFEAVQTLAKVVKDTVQQMMAQGGFDRTVPGIVLSNQTIDGLVDVQVMGGQYTIHNGSSVVYKEGDSVWITIPCNDVNNMFINSVRTGDMKIDVPEVDLTGVVRHSELLLEGASNINGLNVHNIIRSDTGNLTIFLDEGSLFTEPLTIDMLGDMWTTGENGSPLECLTETININDSQLKFVHGLYVGGNSGGSSIPPFVIKMYDVSVTDIAATMQHGGGISAKRIRQIEGLIPHLILKNPSDYTNIGEYRPVSIMGFSVATNRTADPLYFGTFASQTIQTEIEYANEVRSGKTKGIYVRLRAINTSDSPVYNVSGQLYVLYMDSNNVVPIKNSNGQRYPWQYEPSGGNAEFPTLYRPTYTNSTYTG